MITANQKIDPTKYFKFLTFFQIYLPSCTLDDFSGARGPLFGSQGGKIFFHGRHIFSALLRDLVGKYGIDQAESIILVGSGSGARGVGHGCDYLSEVRFSKYQIPRNSRRKFCGYNRTGLGVRN